MENYNIIMGDTSNTRLFEGQQPDNYNAALFSRYYNHVLDLHKAPSAKKIKMAVTAKLLWGLADAFLIGMFTTFWAKFGLGDIKTVIALIFMAALGIIRVLKAIVEYQDKRLSLREREYDFQQKRRHDQEALKSSTNNQTI